MSVDRLALQSSNFTAYSNSSLVLAIENLLNDVIKMSRGCNMAVEREYVQVSEKKSYCVHSLPNFESCFCFHLHKLIGNIRESNSAKSIQIQIHAFSTRLLCSTMSCFTIQIKSSKNWVLCLRFLGKQCWHNVHQAHFPEIKNTLFFYKFAEVLCRCATFVYYIITTWQVYGLFCCFMCK